MPFNTKRTKLINDPLKALHKVADYLAQRDHSEKELQQKLAKNFTDQAIKKALLDVKSKQWLPAPEELAAKVSLQLGHKNKGFLYIQKYLHNKGLPAIKKDQEQEYEKAKRVLEVKLTQPLSTKSKEKAQRLLANRGFDFETICFVINNSDPE